MLEIAGSTLPLARRPSEESRRAEGPERWRADLRRVKDCGFTALDLVDSWLRVDLLDADRLEDLSDAMTEEGITPIGLSVVRASVIDPQDGEKNLGRTLSAIDAAARLRMPIVSVGFHRPLRDPQLRDHFWVVPHPEDEATDANFGLASERLRRLCDHASGHGIDISLELHEATLLDRSARILRLLDEVSAANLGVNLDIGNLVRVPHPMAEPWNETVERLAAHVNYWHLKNYLRFEHSTGLVMSAPVSIEAGEIDYRAALTTVLAAGYRGPLCLEHYGGDAFAAMQRGAGYLGEIVPLLTKEIS